MTDRPIIFSAPMVRALLDGRKTQTRRVLSDQSNWRDDGTVWTGFMGWQCQQWAFQHRGAVGKCVLPPYAPGDRLWVREAWGHDGPDLDSVRRGVESDGPRYGPYYIADADWFNNHTVKRRSPIHMPRWASRLTLTVTDVRVQRLQDISEADAIAEGVNRIHHGDGNYYFSATQDEPHPKNWCYEDDAYRALWNSIHGPDAWDLNPWVVALTFTVRKGNIDAGGEG